MGKLIEAELSYKVIGVLYEVFNQIGYGHREKAYQAAIANELSRQKIAYKRELYFPVKYKDKIVSKYYLDFLIQNRQLIYAGLPAGFQICRR